MMADMIRLILTGLLRGVRTQRALVLENLALRHQLTVLRRSTPRPRLRPSDRLFCVLLSRLWARLGGGRRHRPTGDGDPVASDWFQAPLDLEESAARARPPGGRRGAPSTHPPDGQGQPPFGRAPHSRELQKLGLEISQATVSKYLVLRRRTPPSQTWRTFLDHHVGSLVSVDFFVVPTVLFKVLFVFVVLAHDRRRVVHINVTGAPTARWTTQQLVEALPWETAPRYLLRDRDAVYGVVFSSRAQSMGSTKSRRRLGRLGRIRTWNALSGPCVASASTISSC